MVLARKCLEGLLRKPFRGDIQDLENALLHLLLDATHLGESERAIDHPRGDAVGFQRVHLVFHQRYQGRDNQRQPVEPQRGQLVAERLSSSCRHKDQAISCIQNTGDDLFLKRQKIVKTKVLL